MAGIGDDHREEGQKMMTDGASASENADAAGDLAELSLGDAERFTDAEVPEDIRQAGRLAPDHWFGLVDPAWRGENVPPSWAVLGEWRSSPEGEIVEWRGNDDYRASPSFLGWPEPLDQIDEAVQLAATGYGPEPDVARLLKEARVNVLLGPEGEALAAQAPDGTPVVPVFTAEQYLPAGGQLASAYLPVTEIVTRLPVGHKIYVNPSAPVAMLIDPDDLADALSAQGRTEIAP
ncbi:type VII secretion system-associated protein [Streptomyces sp. NPDC059215]|uniref:type VII secretion system-associated protein n=1 Tax=Streptomyces sp. NPDC059215 TaxID=3346772 RepID=UPI0036746AF1